MGVFGGFGGEYAGKLFRNSKDGEWLIGLKQG
jgi:hypothetical protein